MQFIVVDRGNGLPDGFRGVVLVPDGWNDFGFWTMYELRIADGAGRADVIGFVRIGHVDMATEGGGCRRTEERLPRQFESLDESFFSLSVDDRYYEKLNRFGADVRADILRSLRDLAYDYSKKTLERVQGLEVYRNSLIRDVQHPEAELERLHLIAHGRERVVDFLWSYTPLELRGPDGTPPTFEFRASPASRPPSNVHALIGRNGVGKTRMMRAMAQGVSSGGIKIAQFSRAALSAARETPNVVVVSFSAFDDLFHTESASPGFTYIGLRNSEDPQRLKTHDELAAEFAHSLATVRIGARRTRWEKILATLRYPGSGLLDDFAGNLDNLFAEGRSNRFKEDAGNLFRPLSSGHKIALLTLTRLVQEVTERTVVFIDEPEAHLQPPLLSAFVRALSDFLSEVNGMAVVATHSPVVLQEVPASCVYKLRRYGDTLAVERPQMETYGENVSELTHEAFGLEATATGFYAALAEQVAAGQGYQEIIDDFESLGSEARGLLRVLIINRDASSK